MKHFLKTLFCHHIEAHIVGVYYVYPFSMAYISYFLPIYKHGINVKDIIMCQDKLPGHLFKPCMQCFLFLCLQQFNQQRLTHGI